MWSHENSWNHKGTRERFSKVTSAAHKTIEKRLRWSGHVNGRYERH